MHKQYHPRNITAGHNGASEVHVALSAIACCIGISAEYSALADNLEGAYGKSKSSLPRQ